MSAVPRPLVSALRMRDSHAVLHVVVVEVAAAAVPLQAAVVLLAAARGLLAVQLQGLRSVTW